MALAEPRWPAVTAVLSVAAVAAKPAEPAVVAVLAHNKWHTTDACQMRTLVSMIAGVSYQARTPIYIYIAVQCGVKCGARTTMGTGSQHGHDKTTTKGGRPLPNKEVAGPCQ